MSTSLNVLAAVVRDTLASLQQAGARDAEGVVLWLGRRNGQSTDIVEAYVPDYESRRDYFRIPPASMTALITHLRNTNTYLAAQVHSHPREAFHSQADDDWAIVRHRGALSFVVPYFASRTTEQSFIADIAAFSLDGSNTWVELAPNELARTVYII